MQLHVKLMNLLAALVIDHIDLAADCGHQQVLAYLLLGDAIDVTDYF